MEIGEGLKVLSNWKGSQSGMSNGRVRLWGHWPPEVHVKPHQAFSSTALMNLKVRVMFAFLSNCFQLFRIG